MKLLIIPFLLFIFISSAVAQEVQQKLPEKTRILFLLDASGSMLANWKGEYRMDAAKRILNNLVDSLRINQNLELGLRVYGHMYFRQSQNCQDTRLEVPFRSGNHDEIINKLEGIKPKGTTPIAYSLEQAANDFPKAAGYRNIIIIITDGIESCDGDPCAVSLALQQKGIFLKPFVIGIGGLSSEYDKQFTCIGKYYNAEDGAALREALNEAIETTLARTTATVSLLNNQGRSSYTNINVTFENNFTNTPAFDFIHYLDPKGRPDTVEVDPVLSYNLIVNTLPPVILRNVDIKAGRHNHIDVKTPQGTVKIDMKGARSYTTGLIGIMKKTNGQIFHIQDINTGQQYLQGRYNLTVNTLPKRNFTVSVEEGKTTIISLPDPGIANFINSVQGYGSVYEIMPDNSQEWIGQFSPETGKSSWVIQPGNYKLVFRSKDAKGSKYTSIKYFTIKPGSSLSLQLF